MVDKSLVMESQPHFHNLFFIRTIIIYMLVLLVWQSVSLHTHVAIYKYKGSKND